ncbi:unnamed protein product [Dovyalis caffra]|uniref:Uncharacterized protein n=1 Tax=Dovyalis caffra TaxID=77055 RepID=A0AAV1SLF6_9ROSI|nr:unnamed protein product [Dovyalis caffra]
MLLIMNNVQPSQLVKEQRNATRLFKQLYSQIQTTLALRDPTKLDVKDAMERTLALDKACPLSLLGSMIEKFPSKFEPAAHYLLALQAAGSAFVGHVTAGALASSVNAFGHGGKLEWWLKCTETVLDSSHFWRNNRIYNSRKLLGEKRRSEMFEMKVAMKLGRILSQCRNLSRRWGLDNGS